MTRPSDRCQIDSCSKAPAFVAEIKARTCLADLVGRDVALKRQGKDHWGLCPFHVEKTPSFKVDPRGFFKCWGCGAKGDAIAWLQQMHGMTFAEAVAELAVAAGLQPDHAGRVKPLTRRASPEHSLAVEARELESRIRWARELWTSCAPSQGSLAELYLRHRGITLPIPPTIRFHGALQHHGSGLFLPAMVAAIQDPAGSIVGVHRTYLRTDGLGKAQVRKPKKVAGRKKGCAVRLAATAPVMVSGEGLETTLSVMQASDLPGWAAIDLGNMAGGCLGRGRPHPEKPGQRLPSVWPDPADPGLLPPAGCETWIWLKDADSKDALAAACLMARAKRKVAMRGFTCREATPPPGTDFNDLLLGKAGAGRLGSAGAAPGADISGLESES